MNLPNPTQPIPLIDLRAQYLALKPEIDAAAARVLDSGWYILGGEVAAFEEEFAHYHGLEADCCAGVNSGTDALQLALRAFEIGPGDEVITVAHTAVATVAAIRQVGATPVLIDVDAVTYTMDISKLEEAITPRTRAIIPVHIYGHPAHLDVIWEVAMAHKLAIIEDCAQAHGATYGGQKVGTIGHVGCFSFYPTKNLGAIGDGGAVISEHADLIARIRELREYGWTPDSRYVSQTEGINSRLDEMQAAILRVKLTKLDAWNDVRRMNAVSYNKQLPNAVKSLEIIKPMEQLGCEHVYHLYVIRTPQRDALREYLAQQQIGSGIHYPVPVHLQAAYAQPDAKDGPTIVAHTMEQTELLASEIVSIPIHPLLTEPEVTRVAEAINEWVEAG